MNREFIRAKKFYNCCSMPQDYLKIVVKSHDTYSLTLVKMVACQVAAYILMRKSGRVEESYMVAI